VHVPHSLAPRGCADWRVAILDKDLGGCNHLS